MPTTPLKKVQIQRLDKPDEVLSALFNPEEYTINKDNNFAVQGIPGLGAPLLQFVNGNMRSLEMELFFDTYDTPVAAKTDVRAQTDKLMQLMEIDSELHAPPVLKVSWASLQFTCVLAKATQKFIMFTDDGTPVRARINVTFNEFVDAEQEAKRANLQTADFTKAHLVVEGETLSGIAGDYYDNAQAWRAIAIANDIDDPRMLRSGDTLRIPSLPFINPETGEVLS